MPYLELIAVLIIKARLKVASLLCLDPEIIVLIIPKSKQNIYYLSFKEPYQNFQEFSTIFLLVWLWRMIHIFMIWETDSISNQPMISLRISHWKVAMSSFFSMVLPLPHTPTNGQFTVVMPFFSHDGYRSQGGGGHSHQQPIWRGLIWSWITENKKVKERHLINQIWEN